MQKEETHPLMTLRTLNRDKKKDTTPRKDYVLVGGEGFEPTKPKQQIYSLPHLTALETSHAKRARLMLSFPVCECKVRNNISD